MSDVRRQERRSAADFDAVPLAKKESSMVSLSDNNWYRVFEGVVFLIISIVGFVLYASSQNVRDYTFQLSRLDTEVHTSTFADDDYNWVYPVTVMDGMWMGGISNAVIPLLISLGCFVDAAVSYSTTSTSSVRRSPVRWLVDSIVSPLIAVSIFLQFGEFSTFSLLSLFGLVHVTTLLGLFVETSNPSTLPGVTWYPLLLSLWLPVFSLIPMIVMLAQTQSVAYIPWSAWLSASLYLLHNFFATFIQAGYVMYRSDPTVGFWPYNVKNTGPDNFATYERTLSLSSTIIRILLFSFFFVSSNDDAYWLYPQSITSYASYNECGGLSAINSEGERKFGGFSTGCPFDMMELNSYTPGGVEGVSAISSIRGITDMPTYTGDTNQPSQNSRADLCNQDDETRNSIICYYPSESLWANYDSAKCGCGDDQSQLQEYYQDLLANTTAKCLAQTLNITVDCSIHSAVLFDYAVDVAKDKGITIPCTCFDMSIKTTTVSQVLSASADNGYLLQDISYPIVDDFLPTWVSSIAGIHASRVVSTTQGQGPSASIAYSSTNTRTATPTRTPVPP